MEPLIVIAVINKRATRIWQVSLLSYCPVNRLLTCWQSYTCIIFILLSDHFQCLYNCFLSINIFNEQLLYFYQHSFCISPINISPINVTSINTSTINISSFNITSINTPAIKISSSNITSINTPAISTSTFNITSINPRIFTQSTCFFVVKTLSRSIEGFTFSNHWKLSFHLLILYNHIMIDCRIRSVHNLIS